MMYAAKIAIRYACGLHRIVYDLHKKFGSGMAAKGSQKIDWETLSLTGVFAALRATRPSPLAAGPLQTI